MRIYFKKIVYLVVLIGSNGVVAGSYDDFFAAIKRDDPKTIQSLLARGFDPNTPSPQGMHGLYLALVEPSPRVTAALLDAPKVDVNALTREGESALMIAAIRGERALAEKLIAKGADLNKTGWAPLHYAASAGHTGLISLFIEHHAFIDAESPNGTTPLMMAAMYGTDQAVQLLIREGADANMKNQQGLTAIEFARRAGRKESADAIAAASRNSRPAGRW